MTDPEPGAFVNASGIDCLDSREDLSAVVSQMVTEECDSAIAVPAPASAQPARKTESTPFNCIPMLPVTGQHAGRFSGGTPHDRDTFWSRIINIRLLACHIRQAVGFEDNRLCATHRFRIRFRFTGNGRSRGQSKSWNWLCNSQRGFALDSEPLKHWRQRHGSQSAKKKHKHPGQQGPRARRRPREFMPHKHAPAC